MVTVGLVAMGISIYSVLDLLGDDPDWVESITFTLFGPAALAIGYHAWRKRPPA